MAHRDLIAIDFAGMAVPAFSRREVGDNLVPVEIEIDPVGRRTAFGTAEQFAVKRAGGWNIVYWKREMKRRH
jgi:hypothetical protein